MNGLKIDDVQAAVERMGVAKASDVAKEMNKALKGLAKKEKTCAGGQIIKRESAQTTLVTLVALFTSTVVVTNAVSGNLIHVGPFLFVAGTLSYPLTFLLTDIISECFGKKRAQRAVWLGFIAQVISVAFIFGVMQFSSATEEMGEAFRQVFAPVARIVVASMVAYVVAQSVDVAVFHRIKAKTGGKWLWLRNNVATIIAQSVDTALFVAIAFIGVLSPGELMAMFTGQYLAKVILAAADTPFCYLGVFIAQKYMDPWRKL